MKRCCVLARWNEGSAILLYIAAGDEKFTGLNWSCNKTILLLGGDDDKNISALCKI